MNRQKKKELGTGIFWILLLLVIIVFPEFAPVVGFAVIAIFGIKALGHFLDSHL